MVEWWEAEIKEKHAPVPFDPPKILHEVSGFWTQGSASRSQCLMTLAIGWTSKELGFNSWQGWRLFSLPLCVGEPQGLPSLLSSGYQGLSLGVYFSEHAANHSCPSSAEVKNDWSYTSTPLCIIPAIVLNWLRTVLLYFYLQLHGRILCKSKAA
jgi:hypothetical protein